jgi:hypothetical protein
VADKGAPTAKAGGEREEETATSDEGGEETTSNSAGARPESLPAGRAGGLKGASSIARAPVLEGHSASNSLPSSDNLVAAGLAPLSLR